MPEFCGPCRKEGRLTVAVYQTSKGKPPMCFNCYKGKGHAMVALGEPATTGLSTQAEEVNMDDREKKQPRLCKCGCGEVAPSNRSPYVKGHNPDVKKKPSNGVAVQPRKRKPAAASPAANGSTVNVKVTEAFCNRVWQGLSLQEKADLIFSEGR